jgi:hypothetical protein
MRILIVLIFISSTAYTQVDLDLNDTIPNELISDEYFKFELVKINNEIYNSIDSILIIQDPMDKNNIFYLEVMHDKSVKRFLLSSAHIEELAYVNSLKKFKNKATLIRNKIIIIRDNNCVISTIYGKNNLVIKNPKELNEMGFIDASFWVFQYDGNKVIRVKEVIYK